MAVVAGRAPASVHPRRRLAAAADLGDGHRQPRRRPATATRRSSSRARATTSSRRWPTARPSRSTATSRSSAASRPHRPYAGGDVAAVHRLARRVPGREQRRLHRPVRHQGQRRGDARLRRQGPEQPAAGPGGRDVHRAAEAGRIVSFARARGAAARRPQPRRHARPVAGEPAREREAVAERRAGTPTRRRRWATGSPSGSQQPGPNRDAIGSWIEVRVGDRTIRAGGDGRWRARRRPARAGSTSGWATPTVQRSASVAGRRARAVARADAEPFATIERGATSNAWIPDDR